MGVVLIVACTDSICMHLNPTLFHLNFHTTEVACYTVIIIFLTESCSLPAELCRVVIIELMARRLVMTITGADNRPCKLRSNAPMSQISSTDGTREKRTDLGLDETKA